MPLPDSNTAWPPEALERPYRDISAWAAWWSGDTDALSSVYGGSMAATQENSWEQSNGFRRAGLIGRLQRWFWGQPTPNGEQRAKYHMPLASEIPAVSADLLLGVPPLISCDHTPTQDRIEQLCGEAAHQLWHEGAEVGAALGATYLAAGIDREVEPDAPIQYTVDADAAFPTFRYGRLWEVTFLSEYIEGGVYFRHLQHHSRGLIEHALYEGDALSLGRRIPLVEHSATEIMGEHVVQLEDGRQGVVTGLSNRLDVVCIPNAMTRTWRRIPGARYMGRADISGVETFLDALDDTWSSWMRDLRHGRSRIHVPQHYLRSNGPGQGATVDLDRELYVGLNAMSGAEGMELDAQQFAIRYQEHAATAAALAEKVISGAGYSPQTFGMSAEAAITATESWNRATRSQGTRGAKVRRWRPGLRDYIDLVLELDRVHFAGPGRPEDKPVEVRFQENVSDSPKGRAETAALLKSAEAASTWTLVAMIHPDWDETAIQEEVDRISGDRPAVVSPMAAAFGGDSEESEPAPEEAEDPAAEDDPATAAERVDAAPPAATEEDE